eukprot:363920-Chlamydomonas_euryale.AAC.13
MLRTCAFVQQCSSTCDSGSDLQGATQFGYACVTQQAAAIRLHRGRHHAAGPTLNLPWEPALLRLAGFLGTHRRASSA